MTDSDMIDYDDLSTDELLHVAVTAVEYAREHGDLDDWGARRAGEVGNDLNYLRRRHLARQQGADDGE